MEQRLPRGYRLAEGQVISRLEAGAQDWEIYRTGKGFQALAVQQALYETWCADYGLQPDLFALDAPSGLRFFISAESYLISSVLQGPYPDNYAQIQAFSQVMRQFQTRYPESGFSDAVYIEQYSFLLPVGQSDPGGLDRLYSGWLTGGVRLPISQIDRIAGIMTWLPREKLVRSARMAGFQVMEKESPGLVSYRQKHMQAQQIPGVKKEISGTFSLPGRPELERFLNEHIIDVIRRPEEYSRMGISFPGATVLYGPPGCGKTFAVDKLAEFLGWERFNIDSGTVASPYIHDTGKKISEVFESAMAAAPSVLVIDEMEAFLSDRGGASASGMHHLEEVAEFLRRIPQAVSKGVLIFAMTNMIDSIDPAILRRGRFDHMIEIRMPSAEEVEALLKAKFSELPVDETVDIRSTAESLAGRPFSDVTFVLQEAGRIAVRGEKRFISGDCIAAALDQLPKEKKSNPIGFY